MKNEMKNETKKNLTEKNTELKNFRQFLREEEGMGTVEIILIIVVLVGLVLVFKDQINTIVDAIFAKITRQTNRF